MKFNASKAEVLNRESAPDDFLAALVNFGNTAPNDIFAPNDNLHDCYAYLAPLIGNESKPRWDDLAHRRAAMCELMRVHSGFEASWNWNEGWDRSSALEANNPKCRSAGVFQISFDSLEIDKSGEILSAVLSRHGVERTVDSFRAAMKGNHDFTLEYYARLVRIAIDWAGPLIRTGRNSVSAWLSRDAVAEFRGAIFGQQTQTQ